MTLLRLFSCISILAVVAVIAADLRLRRRSWRSVVEFLRARLRLSGEIWKQRNRMRTDPGLFVVRRVAYLVTLALALVLSLTAFFPLVVLGQHMGGVLLVIHVTVAPFFALCLAILSLLWAHRLRLRAGDWVTLRQIFRRTPPEQDTVVRFAVRTGFWLTLLDALPLLFSIILGLFSWFGTEGQEYLRGLHGYSALAFVLIALVHTHVIITYVEKPVEHLVKEEHQ